MEYHYEKMLENLIKQQQELKLEIQDKEKKVEIYQSEITPLVIEKLKTERGIEVGTWVKRIVDNKRFQVNKIFVSFNNTKYNYNNEDFTPNLPEIFIEILRVDGEGKGLLTIVSMDNWFSPSFNKNSNVGFLGTTNSIDEFVKVAKYIEPEEIEVSKQKDGTYLVDKDNILSEVKNQEIIVDGFEEVISNIIITNTNNGDTYIYFNEDKLEGNSRFTKKLLNIIKQDIVQDSSMIKKVSSNYEGFDIESVNSIKLINDFANENLKRTKSIILKKRDDERRKKEREERRNNFNHKDSLPGVVR